LKDTLATGGPFTVIAPTDEAFAAVPAETLEALIADPDALRPILLYHVLGERQTAYQLFRDSTAVTLEGNPILVTFNQRKLEVNGLRITRGNVKASNGLYHVIEEGVLLPPTEDIAIESVVDVLKLDGRFNTLLTAVGEAGLGEALATLPAISLFAPTDDAFAKIPPEALEDLIADKDALTQVLLYHVVGEKKGIIKLLRSGPTETLQGQTVEADYRKRRISINDSTVLNPDLNTPNGIIQVIDSVLIPDAETEVPDLVDLLVADGRFSTLVAAVQAAGLEDALRSEGPYTVLAPTDAAFARLPEGKVEALLADTDALKAVLLYHVIGGNNSLSELRHQRSSETAQGSDVRIRTWWRYTRINQAWVIDADLQAGNGVAHVLNSVLIPPAE
jgi:uncharacterized surface protein with fasciclin (FAS1) repeats